MNNIKSNILEQQVEAYTNVVIGFVNVDIAIIGKMENQKFENAVNFLDTEIQEYSEKYGAHSRFIQELNDTILFTKEFLESYSEEGVNKLNERLKQQKDELNYKDLDRYQDDLKLLDYYIDEMYQLINRLIDSQQFPKNLLDVELIVLSNTNIFVKPIEDFPFEFSKISEIICFILYSKKITIPEETILKLRIAIHQLDQSINNGKINLPIEKLKIFAANMNHLNHALKHYKITSF